MATTVLQFPPVGDPYEQEVPIWMSFKVGYYSTFSKNRTLGYIKSNAYGEIRVPYPSKMATRDEQNYTSGGSLNIRAVELGGGINAITESFSQELSAKAELKKSFYSGGGVVRFDHLETVLQPGARRVHSFSLNLMAKTRAQAQAASEIASTFQTNTYPIATRGSILTMLHPPLWAMEAIGENLPTDNHKYWDGQPLVSVLNLVDINRAPITNVGFITPDYYPLAININLQFIELEPALQLGDGSANIFSRSDRNAR